MSASSRPELIKNNLLRHVVYLLGWICTALGVAGLFLPLLPTTPFIIAAAWCFTRSSEKAYRWLIARPRLGPAYLDWQTHHVISRRTKLTALALIVLSVILMWISVESGTLRTAVSVFLALVTLFIISQNEKRN